MLPSNRVRDIEGAEVETVELVLETRAKPEFFND